MSTVIIKQRKKIHPTMFTLWAGIASIIMMFAGLTSAYIVKRNQANWTSFDLPLVFTAIKPWLTPIPIPIPNGTLHSSL
jgi:cytochrome c oxidase subunit 3